MLYSFFFRLKYKNKKKNTEKKTTIILNQIYNMFSLKKVIILTWFEEQSSSNDILDL